MHDSWIAERMKHIVASGIRKVFDLAAQLPDPVNLSIGQPDFPVPQAAKDAAHAAIDADKSGYTVTQGTPELRAKLLDQVRREHAGQPQRSLVVTSGTSGGLVLALACVLNPGDEVIFLDPYFVAYPHFVTMFGGVSVMVDSYPDFRLDVNKIAAAVTPRTKAILINSPANPTGVVHERQALRDLARLAKERNILLISDEVYRAFCYDGPFVSAAQFNEDVLVVDGFSKAYGMTGWRLGFAHGPNQLIEEMTKLQQFTYVCAPSMVQWAGVAALACDLSSIAAAYKKKRDLMVAGLKDRFEMAEPGGAFYMFVRAPWGTASEFVTEAIRHNLLIIPGGTFSRQDSHFRVSYAATDETLQRGIAILNELARR